MNITKK